jgi:23S rRNA (guanosine2251-2'-O)-methyltransferase
LIIFGMNPVREAIRAHPDRVRYVAVANDRGKVRSVVEEAKEAGIAVRQMSPQQLDRMAKGTVHNGIVAEVAEVPYADLDEALERGAARVFILDGVQDPQNLGAILRVADCFAVDLVVIPEHESAGLTGAAIKASAGAASWVAVAQVTNLSRAIESLKEKEFWVYAADAEGDPLDDFDLRGKVAVILGNEGKGIRKNVLAHADRRMAIPISGRVESLNVATAAAVIGWEITRQNRGS